MFSSILNVAIGLIFMILLLSLACTAVNEFFSRLAGMRARTLEEAIRRLLDGTSKGGTLAEAFYELPLIKSLYEPTRVIFLGKTVEDRGKKQINAVAVAQPKPTIDTSKPQKDPSVTGNVSKGKWFADIFKLTHKPSYASPQIFSTAVLTLLQNKSDELSCNQQDKMLLQLPVLKNSAEYTLVSLALEKTKTLEEAKSKLLQLAFTSWVILSASHDNVAELIANTSDEPIKQLLTAIQTSVNDPKQIPAQIEDLLIRAQKELIPNVLPNLFEVIFPVYPTQGSVTLKTLKDQVSALNTTAPSHLTNILLMFMKTGDGTIQTFRTQIEKWFDEAMDRSTGWYKRKIQWITFVTAFTVVIGANADAIGIARALYQDQVLQTGLADAATMFVKENPTILKPTENAPLAKDISTSISPTISTNEVITTMLGYSKGLTLPIGWNAERDDLVQSWQTHGFTINTALLLLLRIIGWIIMVGAASLGAPFWFDLLSKFVNLRSTGKESVLAIPSSGADIPKVKTQLEQVAKAP